MACDVPWWQIGQFEIDKDSYGGRRQHEFGLNGPNEYWTNGGGGGGVDEGTLRNWRRG